MPAPELGPEVRYGLGLGWVPLSGDGGENTGQAVTTLVDQELCAAS